MPSFIRRSTVTKKNFREANGDVFGNIRPGNRAASPRFTRDERLRDFPPGSRLGRWGEVYAPQSYGEARIPEPTARRSACRLPE